MRSLSDRPPSGSPPAHDPVADAAGDDARLLRQVLAGLPVGVVVRQGPDLRIVFANGAAELIGGRVIPLGSVPDHPSAVASGLYQAYDKVRITGQVLSLPAHRLMFHPPGKPEREAFIDITLQPLRDAEGRIDGVVAVGADVTAQVQARLRSEAMEQRYSDLLQSLDAIVWEAPAGSDRWSFVSDRAEVLLQYPREKWSAGGFWRSILHPDDRDRVIAASGAAKGDKELEYRIVAADGRVLWVQDRVRVQLGPDGRPVASRGVMLDITARKEAEFERERISAQMVQVQKLESLGVMAGGLAHDFNNLLTVILGNASLAAMRLPEHSPARSSLDDLVATAQRAADLTRQLLAYSGRGQLSMESLDLGTQVQEILGLLSSTIPKKVSLELDLDPLLPPIEGDPTQMQQVVMNLVTNASEAIADGRGRIRVATFAAQIGAEEATDIGIKQGNWAALAVEDTGCGMDAATRQRVFDPFFTTRAHGRGLGLAAVHGIVRAHRGAIEVRSEPGKGSIFTVYFPCATQRPVVRPVRTGALRGGSGLVLLIDDEDEVRATARAMIEALGYDVLEAGDGRRGLDLLARHRDRVRAVVLDMTMPVMSGEEVYREMRIAGDRVPVILSTGYSPVDARRRGLMEGLAAFLQKPYTVRQLADALAGVMTEGAASTGDGVARGAP